MDTKQLKRSTSEKKKYLKYYNKEKKAGRKPKTYAQWKAPYKTGLAAAGIDWNKDKPSARLKRSKK